jgi:HK97 family phage major capsid protein
MADNVVIMEWDNDGKTDFYSQQRRSAGMDGGLKILKKTDDEIVVGGYGVLFGGQDLYGETFSPQTDFMLDLVPVKLITYDHTLDETIPDPIGKSIKEEIDNVGIWLEAQLDKSNQYIDDILRMVEEGRIGLSSGTIGHLVQLIGNTLKRWIIVEYALTPTPAEPRLLGVQRIKSITQNNPGLKALLAETSQDDVSSDATDGDNGNRKSKDSLKVDEMSEKDKQVVPEQPNEKPDVPAPTPARGIDPEEIVKGVVKALEPKLDELVQDRVKSLVDEEAQIPAFRVPKNFLKTAQLGDPDPVEDFYNYIRTGKGRIKLHTNHEAMLPIGKDGAMVKAALQEGTDSEGGYLVPNDVLNQITEKRDEQNLLSSMGITPYSTDRDKFDFPAEDTAMTDFTIVAEEATHTPAQNEPDFAMPQALLYKFVKLIKISEELDEDYNTGLAGFLTRAIGRSWASTENYYVQIGSGSGQPQGVFVGGTAGLTLASASAIAANEPMDLIGKLKIPYRDRAVMVMNRTTGATLSGLTGNQFVFRQPPASQAWANGEDLGIGYPVKLTEDAAAIGASAKSMLFGNFEFYGWVRNRSLRILRLGELYRETGQIGIRAWFRAGGVVLQAEAFQYATHPTG